jgi:hypothetical protein
MTYGVLSSPLKSSSSSTSSRSASTLDCRLLRNWHFCTRFRCLGLRQVHVSLHPQHLRMLRHLHYCSHLGLRANTLFNNGGKRDASARWVFPWSKWTRERTWTVNLSTCIPKQNENK